MFMNKYRHKSDKENALLQSHKIKS